jgi:hypothetical protein
MCVDKNNLLESTSVESVGEACKQIDGSSLTLNGVLMFLGSFMAPLQLCSMKLVILQERDRICTEINKLARNSYSCSHFTHHVDNVLLKLT